MQILIHQSRVKFKYQHAIIITTCVHVIIRIRPVSRQVALNRLDLAKSLNLDRKTAYKKARKENDL